LLDEVANLNYPVPLAEALLSADPKYGSVANVQEAMRVGFPQITSPTMGQALDFLQQVLGGKASCQFEMGHVGMEDRLRRKGDQANGDTSAPARQGGPSTPPS
jgi:hypothetical protein